LLKSLSIKNYALIDSLEVQFSNGLTIITGETGAGKSILLGGLSMVLGKRADLSSLKNKEKKCVIEASFNLVDYPLKAFFKQHELDYEDETIIRREILPSGKSRAFINDTPITLNIMSELGGYLIDVHSQHQTLQLTDNEFQFKVIDALSNNETELITYRAALSNFKKQRKKLQELIDFQREANKEQEYNEFILEELLEAKLVADEQETLEATYEALNNVEEIKEHLSQGLQQFSEDEMGLLAILRNIRNNINTVSSLSSQYKDIYERINSSTIELEDIASELERLSDNVEADPGKLDEVNNKLQTIYSLQKKHSVNTVSELLTLQDELEQKVLAVQNSEQHISMQTKEVDALKLKLDHIATTIYTKRQAAIPILKSKLEKILGSLSMENARFNINTTLQESYLINGKEQLQFLFSANKGTDFGELKKVASGGELSRIMLAIKAILSGYMKLPSIMFDEIDTGVSGEVSNMIGDIMKKMSGRMQVFTITHLPQIAAKGDEHFKVYKEDINNITTTNLKKLNIEERTAEIAEMLGGKQLSSSALQHAKQLLN
jgi:DNA repair protein RecN (Recombination protein N)